MKVTNYREPVPTWRIVLYGNIAGVGVAAVAYFGHQPRLYIFALFVGAFFAGFGFLLSWVRANNDPPAPGEPANLPRWMYWLIWGALAANVASKLWDSHKK